MIGSFSESSLQAFGKAMATLTENFAEGTYDFKVCQKPDGGRYGIPDHWDCSPPNTETKEKATSTPLSIKEQQSYLGSIRGVARMFLKKDVYGGENFKNVSNEWGKMEDRWIKAVGRDIKDSGNERLMTTLATDASFRTKLKTVMAMEDEIASVKDMVEDRRRWRNKTEVKPVKDLADKTILDLEQIRSEMGKQVDRVMNTDSSKLQQELDIFSSMGDIARETYTKAYDTTEKIINKHNAAARARANAWSNVDAQGYRCQALDRRRMSLQEQMLCASKYD